MPFLDRQGVSAVFGAVNEHAMGLGSPHECIHATKLVTALQSPQRGEPGAFALESMDSRGGFLMALTASRPDSLSARTTAQRGRTHSGRLETTAQPGPGSSNQQSATALIWRYRRPLLGLTAIPAALYETGHA